MQKPFLSGYAKVLKDHFWKVCCLKSVYGWVLLSHGGLHLWEKEEAGHHPFISAGAVPGAGSADGIPYDKYVVTF